MELPDAEAVKAGFDATKSALETFKRLREHFKNDPEKHEELGIDIERAEKEVLLAEAQIAQALGFKLCLAHNPPVTMLLDRVHPKYIDEIFKCPECQREDPSLEHFAKKERMDASIKQHNERARANSWVNR